MYFTSLAEGSRTSIRQGTPARGGWELSPSTAQTPLLPAHPPSQHPTYSKRCCQTQSSWQHPHPHFFRIPSGGSWLLRNELTDVLKSFPFFPGGTFPAVWQQQCVNKLEQLSCSFPPVSFSLNNFPSKSWGLCCLYSSELNFGSSTSRTGSRGCLFVPAAFASTRSLTGERAATENGNEKVRPALLGLPVGGSQLALSWSALCTSCQGSKTEVGWWAGPLSWLPGGLCGLPDNHPYLEAPLGHRADGSGALAAEVTWVWRFLCKALCWWSVSTM